MEQNKSQENSIIKSKCNIDKIKPGDYWSRVSYGKIINITHNTFRDMVTVQFLLRNEDGLEWAIDSQIIEQEFFFHNQYESEIEMNRTELIGLFVSNPRIIMTVNFNKKVKEKEFLDKILELYPNKGARTGILSKVQFKEQASKAIKNLLTGEERTMIGRHYGSMDEHGRYRFIDMEKRENPDREGDKGFRLIDPRTMNWVIMGGIKYTQKKR